MRYVAISYLYLKNDKPASGHAIVTVTDKEYDSWIADEDMQMYLYTIELTLTKKRGRILFGVWDLVAPQNQ